MADPDASRPGDGWSEIRLERVTRRYGRTTALSVESLALERGEYVALFGRNGAGKSTLLRILATALRPTRGRIYLDDLDFRRHTRGIRARLGVLGHGSSLYPSLTGRENLVFFGHLHGVPDPGRRADEFLRKVGLEARAQLLVRGYSRGMIQRLALARALLHRPSILLLDEPFTGLDVGGVRWLADTLRALNGDGATIVVADQNVDRGLEAADRSLLFDRGRILREWSGRRERSGLEAYRTFCKEHLGGGGH
jgi:heme exporter protein A